MDAVQVEKAVKALGGEPTLKNFIAQFGLYSNTPDSFTRLKELVLGLAFEGKLVEQFLKSKNLLDELEISEKKIDKNFKHKKGKNLKDIDDDEITAEFV